MDFFSCCSSCKNTEVFELNFANELKEKTKNSTKVKNNKTEIETGKTDVNDFLNESFKSKRKNKKIESVDLQIDIGSIKKRDDKTSLTVNYNQPNIPVRSPKKHVTNSIISPKKEQLMKKKTEAAANNDIEEKIELQFFNSVEVYSLPKIKMHEIKGNYLEIKEIIINAKGPLQKTSQIEGITTFGSEECDFKFESPEMKLVGLKMVYSIIFNHEYKTYFIKNNIINEYNLDLFVQLEKFSITEKNIIVIGEYQFIIEVDQNNKSLNIEFGYQNCELSSFNFPKSKSKILIGRKRDCDIILDDPTYPRYCAEIEFKEDFWDVKSKEVDDNKIWILIEKGFQYEIFNEMKVKCHNSILSFNIFT